MQPLQTSPGLLVEAPDVGVPQAGQPFLNHLRSVALNCRVMPKTGLFEVCAQLEAVRGGARDAHAEALMRGLSEALGKPVNMFAPGTSEMTFDERWLSQLASACHTGDGDSQQFLLRSRIGFEHRRLIRFLVFQASRAFQL